MTTSIGVSIAITLSVFAIIDKQIQNNLVKLSEKYRNHPFQDRTFPYANWAKMIEVSGLLIFTIFFLLLISNARDIVDVIVFSILSIATIVLMIYRSTMWKHQLVMLRGNHLICITGKKRKKIKVNLNEIDSIEISYFQFIISMNNNKKVRFPTGYNNQSYIYGILKYHRPEQK